MENLALAWRCKEYILGDKIGLTEESALRRFGVDGGGGDDFA